MKPAFRRPRVFCRSLTRAFACGLFSLLLVSPLVFAQTDSDDTRQDESSALELEGVSVIGSRLSKADIAEALPVTVFTKQDIVATGQPTVAEVLRTLPYNSQGSSTPSPGSTAQGVTDINLRGLGYGRTLVLVNGRRVPADSTFFGFAVSTNFIPIGAVERIEVLRDGASAIYGSDALGGVINIVLHDEFDGTDFSFKYDAPESGGGNALVINATTGVSGEHGGFVLSVEKRKVDALRNRQRAPLRADHESLGFGFLSNSFPPTYRSTDFFGDGSNMNGPWATSPTCNADRVLSGGPFTIENPNTGQVVSIAGQAECRNPVADKADHLPRFDVDSAYLSGHWNVTDQLRLFAEAMMVNQDTLGTRQAVTGSLQMAADNPNNPTRTAGPGNPVAGVESARDISVLYALPDEYTQRLETLSQQRNWVGGFSWSTRAGDLSGHYQYASQNASSRYRNALYTTPFLQTVAAGELDLFDPASTPAYAPFLRTGQRITVSELNSASLNWSSQIPGFELPAGPIAYGLGYEWRKESLHESCDALSGQFALVGSFCFPFRTQRSVDAGYLEASVPLLSNLELLYAGRWDRYDVPKFNKMTNRVALRYQPVDSVTLRGSWADGIRAPNLFELNSSSGVTTSNVIDTLACTAAGGDPSHPACFPIQVKQILRGGPNLSPERARTLSVGAIWSPTRALSIAADYFKVRINDQIQNIDNETVLELEAQGLDLGLYSVAVERDAHGDIVSVTSGSANVPGFSTRGVDTETTLHLDLGQVARLNSQLNLSWILAYDRPAAPGAPSFNAVRFVGQPRYLGNWNNTLSWSAWAVNLRLNHTAGYDARTPEEEHVLGIPFQGRIGSYQTIDLNVAYTAPWNGRISAGVRNLADRTPTINRHAFGQLGYNTALADIYGRVFMLSYTQSLR